MRPSFLALILFFISAWALHGGGGADESALLDESQYWPDKITVKKEVTGRMHGNAVPAGREWIFLRYEEGKCLVDMGHNGIFRFEPEDTDIVERIRRNEKERPSDFQGLFTHRFTKAFFDPATLKGYQFGGPLESCEYFLLIFFDYQQGSVQAATLGEFVRDHAASLKDKMDVGTLLVPSGNIIAGKMVEDYLQDGLNAPTIAPYKHEAMLYTLQYEPDKQGDVLLVDKSGRFLGHFFLSDLSSESRAESLHKAVVKMLER